MSVRRSEAIVATWRRQRGLARSLLLGGLVCLAAASARAAEPIPFELPAHAPPVVKQGRHIGWGLGLPTNQLVVLKPDAEGSVQARNLGPLAVDAGFRARRLKTVAEWEGVRVDLKRSVAEYFGVMPRDDVPLDPRDEAPEEDRIDHVFKIVSVAFDEDVRGRIGLLAPRVILKPTATILIIDRQGGGIEAAAKGAYSWAIAAHLVREGFVVAVLEHWDGRFGDSRTLCTAGAAAHMVRRAVSYLRTLDGLVDPKRIGYWGHGYGADLIPFIASREGRIACYVSSCTRHELVRPYTSDGWRPPCWAVSGEGLAPAARAESRLFASSRAVATRPLPFLTQEAMALVAPRPMLVINASQPDLFEAVQPVWDLYGRGEFLERVSHRWGEAEPVNAREHATDFFLRTLYGVNPGHPPPEMEKDIRMALRTGKPEDQIRAARLAGWWRASGAVADLADLLSRDDPALRRAAAKALQRIGAMKEMVPCLRHPDPIVRLAAVEMMQVAGTEEAYRALGHDDRDDDRSVSEAKWQTLQVSPWK